MTSLRTQAEGLRIALDRRFVSFDDVMAWIEAEIVARDAPPLALLDAACARTAQELSDRLGAIDGDPDRIAATRVAFFHAARTLASASDRLEEIALWAVFVDATEETCSMGALWSAWWTFDHVCEFEQFTQDSSDPRFVTERERLRDAVSAFLREHAVEIPHVYDRATGATE